MNVDLLPDYYWDIVTPTDGEPGPIYLAIMKVGMSEPHMNLKARLHRDSDDYCSEVVQAMKSLEMHAPELFDHDAKNAKNVEKFRYALEEVIENYSATH